LRKFEFLSRTGYGKFSEFYQKSLKKLEVFFNLQNFCLFSNIFNETFIAISGGIPHGLTQKDFCYYFQETIQRNIKSEYSYS